MVDSHVQTPPHCKRYDDASSQATDDGEDDGDVDGSRAATGGASEHGRAVLLKLAESADVFVHALRSEAMAP